MDNSSSLEKISKEEIEQSVELTLKDFLLNVENIDRACSTVIENSIAIFLPHKRLDKTDIQKEFYANNQVLEIENDLFDKVEIRGRLLGQVHKDILEVLLTSDKIYDKTHKRFQVKLSAYKCLKKLGKSTGNKKWLLDKISEIAECRVVIFFKGEKRASNSFNFNFINSILNKEEKEFTINFTPEYTHFMARNEMLDYSNYIDDILSLENEFLKAVVRYVLTNNGKNNQISIDKLIDKMRYKKLVSDYQLDEDIRYLRKDETQELLREKFGITLTNDEKTITFNSPEDKKHYYIRPNVDENGQASLF